MVSSEPVALLESSATVVVALTGAYLLVLAASAFMRPDQTLRFLRAFAGTATKHYLEMAVRLLVGGAFVLAAPSLTWPVPFQVFGWLLVGTTAALCLAPWRLHQRLAKRLSPSFAPLLPVIGLASLVAGILVLTSVFSAGAA